MAQTYNASTSSSVPPVSAAELKSSTSSTNNSPIEQDFATAPLPQPPTIDEMLAAVGGADSRPSSLMAAQAGFSESSIASGGAGSASDSGAFVAKAKEVGNAVGNAVEKAADKVDSALSGESTTTTTKTTETTETVEGDAAPVTNSDLASKVVELLQASAALTVSGATNIADAVRENIPYLQTKASETIAYVQENGPAALETVKTATATGIDNISTTASSVAAQASSAATVARDKAVEFRDAAGVTLSNVATQAVALKDQAVVAAQSAGASIAESTQPARQAVVDAANTVATTATSFKDQAVTKAVEAKDFVATKAEGAKASVASTAADLSTKATIVKDQAVTKAVEAKDTLATKAEGAKSEPSWADHAKLNKAEPVTTTTTTTAASGTWADVAAVAPSDTTTVVTETTKTVAVTKPAKPVA